MVEKNTKEIAPGLIATFDPYKFEEKYADWAKKMAGLSGDDIGVTGGGNLLEHITSHVDTTVRRSNSTNSGNDGAFVTLDQITKILTDKDPKTPLDLEKLEDFADDIEGLLGDDGLDPRNTLFTEPSEWSVVDGELVIDDPENTVEVYGHYRTPFFEAKSKGKLKAKPGFYSFSKDTAEPPYYLALFSNGESLAGTNITGLLPLLKNAIQEIEMTEFKVDVTSAFKMNANVAKKLASVSSVRKAISTLLKNKTLWDGSRFKAKEAADALATKELKITGKDIGRINEILGIVGRPTITLKLDRKQFMALYSQLDTYSRSSNFNERESPVNGEKIVVKSWTDLLRV